MRWPMPAAALCVEARLRNDWIDGVGPEVEREIEQGERLTRCAAELGGDDATTRATAGFVLVRVAGHQDDGAAFIERALNLNVNLARAWLHSAWVRIWLGEPERAIRHHQAMRFSPLDPWLCDGNRVRTPLFGEGRRGGILGVGCPA